MESDKEVHRMFQMFDRNSDGRITTKELKDSLKSLGIHMDDKDLSKTIETVDSNGDGFVDEIEFGVLYKSIMAEKGERNEEEDMREAFNVFDQNGDGFISVEELRSILESLGLREGKTLEDCKRMIGRVDIDGDGHVDFNEFQNMVKGGGFAALT